MIEVRRYADLGGMDIGWLNAHYHFSFADYHDPKRMGLGNLRVVNDDVVRVGGGFGMHPHRDMEIVTFVRSGAITHRDSLGNEGKTSAGEVQVMSAGTGIVHAEENRENVDTNLYQIWLLPREKAVQPRWEQRNFPVNAESQLPLLVSGLKEHEGRGALFIHSDAAIYGGQIAPDHTVEQELGGGAYLLVSRGRVRLGSETLQKGDGTIIRSQPLLSIQAEEPSEVVLIDLPTLH